MADENNEDDSWLYGGSNENHENQENQDEHQLLDEKTKTDETIEAPTEHCKSDEYPDAINVSSNDHCY